MYTLRELSTIHIRCAIMFVRVCMCACVCALHISSLNTKLCRVVREIHYTHIFIRKGSIYPIICTNKCLRNGSERSNVVGVAHRSRSLSKRVSR